MKLPSWTISEFITALVKETERQFPEQGAKVKVKYLSESLMPQPHNLIDAVGLSVSQLERWERYFKNIKDPKVWFEELLNNFSIVFPNAVPIYFKDILDLSADFFSLDFLPYRNPEQLMSRMVDSLDVFIPSLFEARKQILEWYQLFKELTLERKTIYYVDPWGRRRKRKVILTIEILYPIFKRLPPTHPVFYLNCRLQVKPRLIEYWTEVRRLVSDLPKLKELFNLTFIDYLLEKITLNDVKNVVKLLKLKE